ncbi:helix-turn-helix domain-containing protein [Lentzea sp. BCCO 10_0798]|uniref:Helix-turn-helix domain-containing protein n=1 Tax=Lentzea kristufekii TaxID=3095430 RepID=A0ABU4TKK6_9PSEU|nr:helix-turn-helix domain-containing protein [Lentzea sp. BCCO 10_0798]MDX8048805.1 helix-turn-helix domain-containing protein [Lentzea sp. BCCO 10_0798]
MREFGELLRTHRIGAGLTQQQLADFAMVSVRAIRDLECGRTRSPRAETVRLLADGLRLDEESRADLQQAGGRAAGRSTVAPPAPAGPGGLIVGREAEAAALAASLTEGRPGAGHAGQRLVTVTGVSGVGKTRLALEVAGELHFRHGWSVLWHPSQSVPSINDEQDTVLVTDRRPDPCLLDAHPRLRIVVTALAPTELPGELVFPLGALADDAAVRLLLTHVHRVRPAFRPEPANQAALVGLVHELDGLPSALEFAAGWFMVYSPQHLLERLRSNPLDPTSAHLRDSLRRSLSTLDVDGRELLVRMAEGEDPGHSPYVRDLCVRGLVRRTGSRYEALNLVRAAVLEPVSGPHLAGGVALTWPV